MLSTTTQTTQAAPPRSSVAHSIVHLSEQAKQCSTKQSAAPGAVNENAQPGRRIAETLNLLKDVLPIQRRMVREGGLVYRAGERFQRLYVVHSGFFKVVKLSADGREQLAGLYFKGDWLGFDGIATGCHDCDTVAMDIGEVWSVSYDALLQACITHPKLLAVMHRAMSREMGRDREALMSLCTLPADARVANFLHGWAESVAQQGLCTDQITLRMTRAEIGNHLGLTLETVSRAMSRLARCDVIQFAAKCRRDIRIPDVGALSAFVQHSLAPSGMTLQ